MQIIQYDDGKRPIYAQCIDQVKRMAPLGVTHKLITHCAYELRNDDYRCASEIVRLTEAAHNPDMFWMDSDCLIKKWPDFDLKPGKPYMSRKWLEAIFIVNGACDFFQWLLDKYNKEGISRKCWLRELFLNNRKEFEIIPEGYITHIAMSRAVMVPGFNSCGSQDYRLYRDKVTQELKLELLI